MAAIMWVCLAAFIFGAGNKHLKHNVSMSIILINEKVCCLPCSYLVGWKESKRGSSGLGPLQSHPHCPARRPSAARWLLSSSDPCNGNSLRKVKASQSLHLQKYHSWGKIWGNRVSADKEWCILRLRHWLMVTWYWGYSRLADRETGSDSAQSWTFGWSRRGGEPPVAWLLNKLFEERLSCNEVALEVSMYLLSTTLTAAGGRLGTVVLSSLSPPCQRQTRECYKILWSNNFATSEVLILFHRNSWQISDLHEGGAAAHEQAGSQSRCSLSSSLSGSAWQHSCKNDWPGQWGRPRVSQG